MKLSEYYDEINGIKIAGGRSLIKNNLKPEVAQLEAENERLDKRWARHYRSLAEDLTLAYDSKRESWREYIPETTANEIDALLTGEDDE